MLKLASLAALTAVIFSPLATAQVPLPEPYARILSAEPEVMPGLRAPAIGESDILSYDSLSHDGATGITRFAGVTILGEDGVELTADEVRIWGLDGAFLEARLNGEALDREGRVFSRLQASGIAITGIESEIEAFGGPAPNAAKRIPGARYESDVGIEGTETYSVRIASLTIDAVTLHPFLSAVPVEGESAEDFEDRSGLPFLLGFSVDALVLSDLTVVTDGLAVLDGVEMATQSESRIGLMGFAGLSRGNIDRMDMLSLTSFGNAPEAALGIGGSTARRVEAEMDIDSWRWTGISLSNLLERMVAGEQIAASERDVLSLGAMEMDNFAYSVNGANMLSMDSLTLDLSGWDWLAPTSLAFEISGMDYDYTPLRAPFIEGFLESAPEFAGQADAVFDLLIENGILASGGDFALRWNGDIRGGESRLSMISTNRELADFNFEMGLIFPEADDWAPFINLYGEQTPSQEAGMERLIEENLALTGVSASLVDNGLLENGFATVIALAQIMPDTDPQFAALGSYDVPTLRNMAAMLILVGSAEMEREFPQAQDYAMSLASFVRDGGRLDFRIAPQVPLNDESITRFEERRNPSPEDVITFFGLSFEHTP